MSRAAVPPYGLLAGRLSDLGYQSIPLNPESKTPAVREWPDYFFDRRNRDNRSRGVSKNGTLVFPDFATGIVCGACIGLDVDVRDSIIVKKLKKLAGKLLGPGPDRVGKPPKFLRVYRADKPFAKITSKLFALPGDRIKSKSYKFHLIEVLAKGQQFASFGIHGGTKRPYQWSTPGGLLTIPLSELTVVTEAQLLEFVAAAENIMLKAGAKVHARSRKCAHEAADRGIAPEALQARDPTECRQALAAIPNNDESYEIWWRVGLACAAALGESGRKDFIAWSRKSDKHDTDNEGEPVPGYTHKAYTSFLKYCASGKSQITAGTIIYMAQQAGWKRADQRIGMLRMWRRAFDVSGMHL
jgi:hypothetical protein